MSKLLLEAKNLDIYKKLLTCLGEWCDSVPGTGIGQWLNKLIEQGVSSIPSDKRAQAILEYLLDEYSVPKAVQFLTNWNFSCLPYDLKPSYKDGNKHLTAFWKVGDMNEYKVKSLLNTGGPKGSWVDQDGNKVTLIDITREKEAE